MDPLHLNISQQICVEAVCGDTAAYFIFVTTITTAGRVKKSVKCKIFQWIRERNCFDIAQNV